MLLKEQRSKSKPPYALLYSQRTFFRAASERTFTEKTNICILLITIVSFICHLRFYTVCFGILFVSLNTTFSHFFMFKPRFQNILIMEIWSKVLETYWSPWF
ncbi:hypothetical protein EYF80_054401 [Liparis tanakae]|uniref:Uncharacterized protein n=1 Tax=Liparis tanakae TaxID=230148 RepID=A0A4Z2F3I1_9TELE|nr:hypothetical protein EYF80_054401 [Liparis tanakae]